MTTPATLPLGSPTPSVDATEEVTDTLPPFDHGYFDALAAIGFAALADTYFETPEAPLIRRTPAGFAITYHGKLRDRPQRSWLKYTIPASWAGELEKGTTKKAPGWDGTQVVSTEGAAVDTSDDTTTSITVGNKVYEVKKPDRQLYGVINKLGKPDWLNLCVYACRHRGLELLDGTFEESSVTFNSVVLPQGSKGGNASNAFSIGNSSLPKPTSRSASRRICLAVAGLLYSATGNIPEGFAVPVPRHIRLESLRGIISDNRLRLISGGFFFPYDNYLNYLKLLLRHKLEPHALDSVGGANFIELGAAPSPAGSWQFAVPAHRYTEMSAERLQTLLYRWKKVTTPKAGSPPSINREAVRLLVGGFERSDPASAAEGYLGYIGDAGFSGERPFYPLYQTFFEEIMANEYSELLGAFDQEDVRAFINLVRQETYRAVYPRPGQTAGQPNYQMMRRLREVQSTEDLLQALTEIAVERGTSKLASAKGERDAMKFMSMPFEPSITRLVQLAEDERYNARMIAQLVLALALSRREGDPASAEADHGGTGSDSEATG
jgi:hypothetical protein